MSIILSDGLQIHCVLMEKYPFLFQNVSALSPPETFMTNNSLIIQETSFEVKG